MNSCIYRGVVRHRRRAPVEHRFEHPLFMMYLDLEELPTLFDGYWLWSARRPELTRNIVTSMSLPVAPFATLQATDERSSLKPFVTITTSFCLSVIFLSSESCEPAGHHARHGRRHTVRTGCRAALMGPMTQNRGAQVPKRAINSKTTFKTDS